MNVEGGRRLRLCAWRLLFASALLAGATGASAGGLYKCGKVFQDRPCESADVQQRFSSAQGTFAIEQVNPQTDKECARVAADAIAWWRRMRAGEALEKLQAEIQETKVSRYEKSALRDVLTAVKNHDGSEREVRGEFESQCMAFKKKNGYPSDREVADVPARSGADWSYRAEARRADAEARRAEAQAQRVDAQNRAAVAPPAAPVPVARPLRNQPY